MAFNILVVDDSLLARTFMDKALRLSGIDIGAIFQAENGKQALKAMEDEWIDVVFADINMPEMNGIDLVHAMRESVVLRNLPVVIVSTERSETRIEDLKRCGIRAYISKPFTPENLKMVVDGVFADK